MTNPHHTLGRLAVLTLSLAILACTVAARAAAETPAILSQKEIQSLSATPANHERLAAYYREKAEHLRAKAQKFAAQADYLATQPATIESKQGISCNCTSHYRYFSKLYAQEAKEAETLAAQHEQRSKTTP
jgi:hypothetical protein